LQRAGQHAAINHPCPENMRTILARALLLVVRSYVDTTGPQLKMFDGMKSKTTDTVSEHSAPPASDPKP
jgi:hypothetical protein